MPPVLWEKASRTAITSFVYFYVGARRHFSGRTGANWIRAAYCKVWAGRRMTESVGQDLLEFTQSISFENFCV
jgi:hypothetical protein